MLRLIQKSSFMFLFYQGLYYAVFFPLINRDRMFSENPLDLSFVFFLNAYMIWLILGSVWAQEQMENKSNAYAFLSTLPIRSRQIVGAKFALVFLSVAVYVAVHLIWYALSFDDPAFIAAGRVSLIHISCVCLVLAGLYYLGFFCFGYQRFVRFAVALWFLMVVSPLLVQIMLRKRFGRNSGEIILAITRLDPVITLGVCVLLFLGTLALAIRCRENRKILA
jgi:hypothetical protein